LTICKNNNNEAKEIFTFISQNAKAARSAKADKRAKKEEKTVIVPASIYGKEKGFAGNYQNTNSCTKENWLEIKFSIFRV
jgi:hypothetical protein